MAFIGAVTQSGIRNGDVTPGCSVLFSVVFKNLGEIGRHARVNLGQHLAMMKDRRRFSAAALR